MLRYVKRLFSALAVFVMNVIVGLVMPIVILVGLAVVGGRAVRTARAEYPQITNWDAFLACVLMVLDPLYTHLFQAPSKALDAFMRG